VVSLKTVHPFLEDVWIPGVRMAGSEPENASTVLGFPCPLLNRIIIMPSVTDRVGPGNPLSPDRPIWTMRKA